MRNKKTIVKIIQLFFIGSLILQVVPAIQAEPTIVINPSKPEVQSDVSFEVDLSGENVQNAYLWIQECNGKTGVCYTNQNISMTESTNGIYTTTATLEHNDATYFQYTIYADTGTEITSFFKQTKVNIATESNNGNSDNNGDTGSDTPGFEFVAIFVSVIFILLIMYRRRR